MRRWLTAAALVRPAGEGGTVVVVAEPAARAVQALVRWDPAGHAGTELDEREELRFPPVSRMASVAGPARAVADLLGLLRLPAGADVLGPVPVSVSVPAYGGSGGSGGLGGPGGSGGAREEGVERALVRVAPGQGAALASALKAAQIARLALRGAETVRIRVDPTDIG